VPGTCQSGVIVGQNNNRTGPLFTSKRITRMETTNQQEIRHILGEKEGSIDRSLRGQALKRAKGQRPPRTLTAWEWEQWYAMHGVPEAHRSAERDRLPPRLLSWLQRFFGRTIAGPFKEA